MAEFKNWLSASKLHASYLAVMLSIAIFSDHFFIVISLVLLGIVVWQYFHLYRLNRWLWKERSFTPPEAKGTWGEVYDGIYKLQKSNRKRRQELGRLIKRFRLGAESLPDAAIVFDEHNYIVWCNTLAAKLLGIAWPADLGQRVNYLIRNPAFTKYLDSQEFDKPINLPSPLNDRITLEFRIMPYAEGQLLMMARDVTKIRQLENMRKDFVANVSHELRTPLTVLQGYLEMMQEIESLPPAILAKGRDTMLEQTHRMRGLVEQLLVLSNIESSAEDIFQNIVDVGSLLSVVEGEAKTLNRTKSHDISFDIDKSLNAYGVEQELRSAFSNLVFNAIHYTPEKGEINVSWSRVAEGALFKVEDNGDGIAPEHISRLTERFYRVDKARSRKTGGSGLGLAIVKHVLSHHYSELKIESQLEKGSCFSFLIPNNLLPLSKRQ